MILQDRAVVITGAGQGLGRSYAMEAARQGARVIVNDINSDTAKTVVAEIEAQHGIAEAHAGSVAEWDTALALVSHCQESFGRIDGLVNNAGIVHFVEPWKSSPEQLKQIVEVNVLGSLFCGVAAMQAMQLVGSGSIVNITSGSQLGLMDMTAYGATKGAMTSLTYGWAMEAQKIGVRVNAVSPIAMTPMAGTWQSPSRDIIITRGTNLDPTADEALQAQQSSADGVAPIVAYLLSDRSIGLTGQVIRFDGKTVSILQTARYQDDAQLTRDSWTAEELSDALAGPLRDSFCPVGSYEPRLRVDLAAR